MTDKNNNVSRVTFKQIASAIGVTTRAVQQRAQREAWPASEETVRGGARLVFAIDTLPTDIRHQVIAACLDAQLHRTAPAHPALDGQEIAAPGHPGTHAPGLSTRDGRRQFPAGVGATNSGVRPSRSLFTPAAAASPSRGARPSNAAAGVFSQRGNAGSALTDGQGARDAEGGEVEQTGYVRTDPVPSRRPEISPAFASPSLNDRQREVLAARAAIVAEVKRLASSFGTNRAIKHLVELSAAGTLPEQLQALVPIANARGGALSKRTIFRWLDLEKQNALAPAAPGRDYSLADDVAQVLALYKQPNKPPLAWCAKEVSRLTSQPWWPLYNRANRFRKKIPQQVFYSGRHTGAALKALQPFKRRDFLSLAPNEIWVGDGHGAKLKVAHPITGSPFVPEVTVIMDVATRFVVGWSVALSENCLAVADALRHGVERHGIPLIYYSDGGAGQTNHMLDAPITGTLGALGIHHEVGRPGNPQGRGVIERFWQTVLIPLARRFETFQGKTADRDTLRLVSREITRALNAAKSGQIAQLPAKLPAWQQFIDALEHEIHAYNEEHRHRSLPKNFTPATFRAAKLQGAEIHKPQGAELATLFMPSILRKARRGEVALFNGIYFHRDLMLVDGEDVQVAYDIHDVSRVWVKKLSGELIAEAALGGNRGDYMPKPLIERLRDDRAARRMGRLRAQMDEVEAELQGAAAIDVPPLEEIEIEAEPENVVALPGAAGRRPMFDSDAAKYRWLLERSDEITAEDENWLGWYRSTAEWQDLFGERGAGAGVASQ